MRLIVLIAFVLGAAQPAHAAEDAAAPDILSALEGFGLKVHKDINASGCKVAATLNQAEMLKAFPLLQGMGMFNKSLPENAPRTEPFTLSYVMLAQLLPIVTKNVYEKHEDADRCVFDSALGVADDYGNDAKIPAISYKFNRSLYKKINWDNFDSTKMSKVFPSFAISPSLMSKVAEER